MRDGILKMTVMGKTLKVDITNEDTPIHYKARPFSYDFDEAELDQAMKELKDVKRQALHHGVQEGERVRGKARKPWKIEISNHLQKNSKGKGGNKEDFSINILKCIPNLDAAKRKVENVEEALAFGNEKKRKTMSLRKSEDEDTKRNPNIDGDRDDDVGPNGDGMDQHGTTPP